MHTETRRDLLARIAHASLGATGLSLLAPPLDNERTRWQSPMPTFIPPGWWLYRDHLIPNVKDGPFLRAKPTQSAVYLGHGVAITAAHAGAPREAVDVRPISFPRDGVPATADLLLYRTEAHRDLIPFPLATRPPRPGTPLVHAGLGRHRQTPERFAPAVYHFPLTPEEWRAAPERHYSPLFRFESIPFSESIPATSCESGDSGGLILAWNAEVERWELAGLIVFGSVSIEVDAGPPIVLANGLDLTDPIIHGQIKEYILAAEANGGAGNLQARKKEPAR